VHARAVVAENRLRHEGGRLAICMCDLVNNILVDLHVVGAAGQLFELHAEFVLCSGHFVVVLLGRNTHFVHHGQHLGADVLCAIDRRNREVTALGARTVAQVAGFVFGTHVGRQFGAVEDETCVVRVGIEANIVEHEEFGFGTNVNGVSESTRLDVGFCLLGRHARVAVVAFAGDRVDDVAEDCHGGLSKERVHVSGFRIEDQHHVGLVDGLPAGNGRAVESNAFSEHVFVNKCSVHGDVLHLTARVGKAQIDEFNVLFLNFLQDVSGSGHYVHPLIIL